MILIKQVEVYAPECIGRRDVLIGGGQIIQISESPLTIGNLPVTIIEGSNRILAPGLIDSHVHICGGGGEGGYRTRTPELKMTEMIQAGVTTVIGCLGTDGITRTMENLVAKVYNLREEGVSAWCYTGSYQVPVRTLTGDIMKDIMLIDPIIGVGEIALNDHRSSAVTEGELSRIASEARVAGILSGKAGIVNCHLGDGPFDLDQLDAVVDHQVMPMTQFYPTHINRNARLFDKGIGYALKGGMVDLTTSTTDEFIAAGEVPASLGYYKLAQAGVPLERVTFTSDGQGSLPKFNEQGEFEGLGVGSLASLLKTIKEVVNQHGMTLSDALKPATSTPAHYLKLAGKGQVAIGFDADLILLEQDLSLSGVIAKGKLCLLEGKLMVKNTVEVI